MENNSNNISWQRILYATLAMSAIILGTIFLFNTSDKNSVNKTNRVEYRHKYVAPKRAYTVDNNQMFNTSPEPMFKEIQPPSVPQQTINQIQPQTLTNSNDEFALLDSLQKYPAKSINSVQIIVSRILASKGYPASLITIYVENLSDNGVSVVGSYPAAFFEFASGTIHVNKAALYQLNIQQTMAILAHELDHFEKIAQICKKMGINKFVQTLNKSQKVTVNTRFWQQAISYTKAEDSNLDNYIKGFEDFCTRDYQAVYSLYPNLNRISQNIKNPLEISAYGVSDKILSHYKIPNPPSPIFEFAKKFNNIDSDLDDIVRRDSVLKNEKATIFDYVLLQVESKQSYEKQKLYDRLKDTGNMSMLHNVVFAEYKDFYMPGSSFNILSFKKMYLLLTEIEKELKNNFSNENIVEAMRFKINTQLNNLRGNNDIELTKKEIINYLKFSYNNNINKDADRLKYIITLICIANNSYTNTAGKTSLYYIEVPEELKTLYGFSDRKDLFRYIYANSEFKKELEYRKSNYPQLTSELLLVDLMKEYRPTLIK